MAFTLTDGGRQIILDARTGAPAGNVTFGPPCNMKVIDGWWQDAPASSTMSFQDSRGRTFAFQSTADLVAVPIGKLDWVEGPLTLTNMTAGIAWIVLGNK